MKKIIIAALIVLALGLTGCSVSTGSSDIVDDAVAEMPEGDVSNPFAVEPTDEAEEDITDDVVVEDDDSVVEDDPVETEDEGVFGMQTEADDVITNTVVGSYYNQSFRMVDKNRVYNWSVEGLPAGSGLSLEEEAKSWRYKLHGTPVAADIGTHSIIISVVDADSNSTSISFDLTVESNVPEIGINENYVNPCTKPLRIIVEKFGGHVDNEVLNDGVFRAKVGSKVNLKLRAVRGYAARVKGSENAGGGVVPPVGEVKWTWTSQVKDSYHCQRVPKDNGQDHGWGGGYSMPVSSLYKFAWAPPGADCTGAYNLSNFGEFKVEGKYTKNATWRTKTRDAGSDVLEIDGQMLYDGPLPVRDLPVDEDAVEYIGVVITDGCTASNGGKGSHKTIEIGIAYPVLGEGGRVEDVEVEMDYTDVRNYWKSGQPITLHPLDAKDPPPAPDLIVDCDYPGLEPVCESESKLVMLFTDGDGLSDHAWDEFEGSWNVFSAIEDSIGHILYDFETCDKHEDLCEDQMVYHLGLPGESKSLSDVKRIYLMWVVPPKLDGPKTHYADFDIEDIEFKTKYWSADFEDELNAFDNNITKNFVRASRITDRVRYPGMSPANSNGGVFRRRPLAAHILKHQKPKSH